MKVGDKVVFNESYRGEIKNLCRIVGADMPEKGKAYIVQKISYDRRGVLVSELKTGKYIDWAIRLWIKVEPRTNALSSKLATEFIEQDKKVKEQEYEKVFTLTAKF